MRSLLVVLCLVLLSPTLLLADPIVIGETATVRSEVLDENRTLMISLPGSYREEGTKRYPVLWVLDAETRFLHTLGTVRSLARTGHIPELIVIGVTNTDRTRDLTPPWKGDPMEGRDQQREAGGGADNFLEFLTDEAMPGVNKSYRTVPFHILSGHSFGGLFAVHAFSQRPDAYAAVIAISPSLWWDHGRPVDEMIALLDRRPDLAGRLYATLGDEGGDMQAQFKRLTEVLRHRAPASLDWSARILEGEDHGTVPLPTVYGAMRHLFDRWRPPTFAAADGIAGLEQHYTDLSATYGFEIAVPENRVNNLGYAALGDGKVDEAIALFERNVRDYPDSANVYDSLGEGLEAAGRLEEARDNYRRAVSMGSKVQDPNLSAYQAHLTAVQSKLAGN
ncbi:MAG: alpha/beta hydrolase-fold protein [Acidobacteriota bacterium]